MQWYSIYCSVSHKINQLKIAPLAQLVEHLTLNQGVQGSSPWRCTESTIFEAERFGDGVFYFHKNLHAAFWRLK